MFIKSTFSFPDDKEDMIRCEEGDESSCIIVMLLKGHQEVALMHVCVCMFEIGSEINRVWKLSFICFGYWCSFANSSYHNTEN